MTQKTATPGFRQFLSGIRAQTRATNRFPLKSLQWLADVVARANLSIRAKILASLCIVIFLMGITNVVSMLQVLSYSRQYDAIITNITTANSISGSVKLDIDNEMWKIVAGKVEFSEGKQYEIIGNVSDKVSWMITNTDSKRAKLKLILIQRTLESLTG